MTDHAGQTLTPREMVRAHAYPVLAAISTICLIVIAASTVVIARQGGIGPGCSVERHHGL